MTARGADRSGRGRRRSGSSDGSAASGQARRPEQVRRPRRERAAADVEPPARPQRRRPPRRRRKPGLFGLAPTRRAAVLAIVVCGLVLSVAVPLRTYLSQRDDVQIQEQKQAELRAQVQELQARKAQLSDDAQVEAEARRRLRYVMPGETPYVVQLPGDTGGQPGGPPAQSPPPAGAWYQNLWNSVSGG